MPVHETSIKPSTRHIRVDRRFARLLEEDFAISAAAVLDALDGEPQRQAIRIVPGPREPTIPPGRSWREPRSTAGGAAEGHGRLLPAPAVTAVTTAPAGILPRHERSRGSAGTTHCGLADIGVLDRIATRLGVS